MTDNITLPRSVVEQVLRALDYGGLLSRKQALAALHAALDQSDTGIPTSVPAGWKLVPVEPTSEMIAAGKEAMQYSIAELPAFTCYNAMLAAAPQPPALEQPQVTQEPICYVTGHYGGRCTVAPSDASTVLPVGVALYTHQKPPSQPLTNEQIDEGWSLHGGGDAYQAWFMAVEWTERTHGIKGEA